MATQVNRLAAIGRLGVGKAKAAPAPSSAPTQLPATQKKIVGPPGMPANPLTTSGQGATSQTPTSDTGAPKAPPDYSSLLQVSQGYKRTGLDKMFHSQAEKQLQQSFETAIQSGNIDEARRLATEASKKKGLQSGQGNYGTAMLNALNQIGAAPAPAPGQPGATTAESLQQVQNYPTPQAAVGPAAEAAVGQAMTQAQQQQQSEEEQKAKAGEIEAGVEGMQQRVGTEVAGLQDEAREGKAQFDQAATALSGSAMQMPETIKSQFDQATQDFTGHITAAQGVIDQKEQAALSGVMQGKSAAMQAAVQGIQGNVNNQIAQINSNPNLTAAQKQQMTSQVRMQGAMQMAPAVGSTILQFNQLAANTAVAFGQMATNIQTTGLGVLGQMGTAGAEAFARSSVAAHEIGANILSTQATYDNNYIQNQANLTNTRATLDMAGETIKSQLLPYQGVPYADYASPMLLGVSIANDLWKQGAQHLTGILGIQTMQDIAKLQNKMAAFDMAITAVDAFIPG